MVKVLFFWLYLFGFHFGFLEIHYVSFNNNHYLFSSQTDLALANRNSFKINSCGDFPGGPVVKNLPANAGDMGSIPGPGRSHVPPSN